MNRPAARLPSSVSSSDGSAPWTAMPPVSPDGIRSVRRTVAPVSDTADTPSTGPIRPIIATASSGSVASSPNIVWPGATVSRFEPIRSSSASKVARLDSAMPRTATIAAIPIAIPSAVSPERSRRAPRPRPAIRPRSSTPTRPPTRREAGAAVAVMPRPPATRCGRRECRCGAAARPRSPGRG